jgi:ATP-GRASP peptide maturase of grasp-with-spasm system
MSKKKKTILIFSISNDRSTEDVINKIPSEYLILRINEDTSVSFNNININNKLSPSFSLTIFENKKEIQVSSDDILSIWYRRGKINYHSLSLIKKDYGLINMFIREELKIIEDYFWYIIKKYFNHINLFVENKINKLIVLNIAKEVGLNIPSTLITANKSEVLKFHESFDERIITKNNSIPATLIKTRKKNYEVGVGTVLVSKEKIKNLPEFFIESHIQEYISKEYEVRCFYLKGRFYSAAIMSQQNKKTLIDFRNYDDDFPNRVVNYKLPSSIKLMLKKLMKKIEINCGSIDLLVKEGNYYFLEVNPIGQFQWISSGCNFNIEGIIANELIKDEKK